jgi:hypothetical protein
MRVPTYNKEDLLQVLVTSYIDLYQIPSTSYQQLWLGKIDQIVRIKRLTDYLIHKSCSYITWIF